MTPHEVNLVLEGYRIKQKRKTDYDNTMAFIQGRYFVDALLCTVGNMFSGKGAKKLEYPKEPYELDGNRELTEEEKQIQVDALFTNLNRMKENFELAHNKGGDN